MKVFVPVMVQDPATADHKGMQPKENIALDGEDFFLDGPVTARVAVLDFDAATGRLRPGARFQRHNDPRSDGRYVIADENNLFADDCIQVSAFGTVLNTMYMFEENDTLGRPLTWAFEEPQILVVPRAGEWANAYYERESHSLQFYHFPSPNDPKRTVYTSLSHDIVAHETGHAILDGIAPDLYNAITPQSLALHEAIADLTALAMAFRSPSLRETVLMQTGGSISNPTAFSWIAEEFGAGIDPEGRAGYLRSLLNNKTLDPNDNSVDRLGRPNRVSATDPHELSEVLTGALYAVMLYLYENRKRREEQGQRTSPGRALWISVEHFKRMIFRALDYLPPGEVSFADYGRAIIAADQASHPTAERERNRLRDEFVARRIVDSDRRLNVKTNFEYEPLRKIDLGTLVESDWAAYEFANNHRGFLGIPQGIHFRVRPRLDVTKRYYHRGRASRDIRECIFKVSWDRKEENNLGNALPAMRQITVGTTLAIDWETRKVRALLTSDFRSQQDERSAMLRRLIEQDVLRVGELAVGPDGHYLRNAIRAETMNGLMRIRASARLLHIAREALYG